MAAPTVWTGVLSKRAAEGVGPYGMDGVLLKRAADGRPYGVERTFLCIYYSILFTNFQ